MKMRIRYKLVMNIFDSNIIDYIIKCGASPDLRNGEDLEAHRKKHSGYTLQAHQCAQTTRRVVVAHCTECHFWWFVGMKRD